ncbi:hypothetical protein J8F10_30210 [Gemmata sp. G18]|uniref:ATP-grasp domain-containing protein n=1 Tax=Gemmata palustris TaxID=2822762 RepID=A0ABS5C0Q6_9BACT|nr:hypothetical protein [Gemmata palustris]MBP3959539.1 hypothetical protein [Gemmata palustris]
MASSDYCVLCGGDGAWAFEPLARDLAAALWVEVSPEPRRLNYLLFTDAVPLPKGCESFVPLDAIGLAADKRRLAHVFTRARVPIPETRLFDLWDEVQQFRETRAETEWCLKFPTASGASGHRMLTEAAPPKWWPVPFVVQEFVRLERPEVYRIYAAGGTTFGWMARRYPTDASTSPWVAHARGARYERGGEAPEAATAVARAALNATGLLGSFGCVDLLQRPTGEWVALEVGTDGLVNHVDRALGDADMENEIQRRIAAAFWHWVGVAPPWGTSWRRRELVG